MVAALFVISLVLPPVVLVLALTAALLPAGRSRRGPAAAGEAHAH